MSKNSKWMLAVAASAALLVVGQPEIFAADTGKSGPAKVEKVEGSNVAVSYTHLTLPTIYSV